MLKYTCLETSVELESYKLLLVLALPSISGTKSSDLVILLGRWRIEAHFVVLSMEAYISTTLMLLEIDPA